LRRTCQKYEKVLYRGADIGRKGPETKEKLKGWSLVIFSAEVHVLALSRSANQKLVRNVIQTINEGKILPLVLFVPCLL